MKQLEEKVESALFLQQRIPAGFSATEKEHRWHCLPTTSSVIVDGDAPGVVLEKAQIIMNSAPERNDTEYRVVLMVTTKKGWVLS